MANRFDEPKKTNDDFYDYRVTLTHPERETRIENFMDIKKAKRNAKIAMDCYVNSPWYKNGSSFKVTLEKVKCIKTKDSDGFTYWKDGKKNTLTIK